MTLSALVAGNGGQSGDPKTQPAEGASSGITEKTSQAPENLALREAHRLDAMRLDALISFVESARVALRVPGLALGVVEHGRIVFAGGFGERALGTGEPVDADTLFLIASNTKPLTSLMLARLVDQGKLEWETPVEAILPEFRLADPEVSGKVEVRHLLCACTGLAYRNADWEFAATDAPMSLTLGTLARMRPEGAFGTTYSYTNPLVAAAGLVGARLAHPGDDDGAAYDRVMQSAVFEPLGMQRTTFDFDKAMRANHATSHGVTPFGDLARVEPRRDRMIAAVRPAGGAWSSVNDLLAYVRLELSGGLLPDGTRLISREALEARWAPQIRTGASSWYGLGLETDMSAGIPVLFHGGRLYGFRGDMIWLPDHGVGVVILMNSSTGHVLLPAIRRRLLELLFDGRPEAEAMVAAAVAVRNREEAASGSDLEYPLTGETAARVIGHYRSEVLGEIRVEQDGATTRLALPGWSAPVGARRTGDGELELVLITASAPPAFRLVVENGRRALTFREGRAQYTFTRTD